ncbi:MAG: ComEC/Rec2 family competence protein, partial [Planctomycetota bacterium]
TDLRQWMSRERLDHIVYASTVRRAPADAIGQLDSVRLMGLRLFASFSRSGRHVLLETVGTEHGPLALALILGQRDLLQPHVRDRLLVTGTAHLLSVSGLHLAIVLGLVRLITSLLDCSQTAQIIGMLAIGIFYVALTGGRPPVIRAAVLIATLLLAWWVGRVNQPVNSLSLAAIVLAWLMPGEVFSIGILLSFVAVATLLTTSPQNPRAKTAAALAISLESRFDEIELQSRGRWYRWASWCSRGVKASLWLSCSVTAMTLPLVWHQFHVVSWISVFVNVILSALMIAALTTGIATVVIGWLTGGVIASFATVPATLCRWTLQTMDQILIVFENMSYGHVWLPSPPIVWIVAFYLGVLAIVALTHREKRRFWFIGWLALWTSIGVVMATRVSPLPAGTLEATFVDVGHGTAVIMRTKPDAVWLYDCGSMGNATGRRRDIEETLWSMGVTRLRTVCLSHADADHFNGLPSLARRFRIDQVVTPPGMLSETEPALDMIRQTINRYHLPVKTASCTEFTDGLIPSEVSVIHPPAQRLVGSDNANSIVMRIDHGGRSFILPGDLEPPGTESVLNQDRPLPGGVLMAPHHGSTRMRADEVLQWARPAWTIVSGGRRAAQPKVREMLSSAGGRVAITARQGAIRVRMDADGNLDVRSWKDDPW